MQESVYSNALRDTCGRKKTWICSVYMRKIISEKKINRFPGIMFYALVVWICCFGIVIGISVNFDPVKPALGNSMTVTCQRSSSSTSSIFWDVDSSLLITCDGSTNEFCVPSPPGYTFSTDVSANEFNLTLAATVITDCKTYTCTDTGNTETISKNIQLADFSKNDITQTEPGANTGGSISITTGCVLSPDDLTITWTKIVDGSSVALSADDPSPVTSTDRSTCTRTCHTEEDQKATSGFTHTEYTGTNSKTFQYMVTVSHSSYPDNADIFTWTSANYTRMKATTVGCWCCLIDCKDIEIGVCYFANIMIYIIIFVVFFIIVGIVVEAIFNIWEKMSSTWRILSFVVFLFGIGLFICNYIKRRTAGTKKKIYSCVIGSCLVSTGTGTGLYYKLLRDEQKEGNITPLSKSSGDTITIGCLLPGTFTCPEWRGPPSFTPFTNFNDCTINPEVPAASRLLYDTDNRSLILSNAQTNDSGDYKCAYTKKGDHTIRLTVNPATNNASTYGTTTTSASTYDTTTTSAPTYGTTQKPSSGEKLPVCLMGCIFSTVIAVIARFGLIG